MSSESNTMITFDDFKISRILKTALSDNDFIYPTPIQNECFAPIMAGKNLVGVAQTGTGKSLAYILPLLQSYKYTVKREPVMLILVPTRELVEQLVETIENLTECISVDVLGVYGGTNINTQKQKIVDGCQILVATPGRLFDLYVSGILKLRSVKKLVIDEVDEMLDLGFRPQLVSIMECLPEKRQNLMFSATLSEEIEQLISDFFSYHEKIEIAPSGTPIESITQQQYHVPNFYTKVNLLKHLLSGNEDWTKVLVFCENKRLADLLFSQLEGDFGEEIGIIHSNKSQNYRFRVLENFDKGLVKYLISTDILSRGLDIDGVTHVINFDVPKNPINYVHRIGRTARYDKTGFAISFVNEAEQEYIMEAEALMSKALEVIPFPEEVKISNIFTDEERPSAKQKVLTNIPKRSSQGAFHEKSIKNRKVNSGSPALKRKKYKKPITRSGKRK